MKKQPVKRKIANYHQYEDEFEDNYDTEDEEPVHHDAAVDAAAEQKTHRHSVPVLAVHDEHFLQSVLTYHEGVVEGVERKLASRLDNALAPLRTLMLVLFRFPLYLIIREDLSREYTYSWKSYRGWMFFITAGLLLANCIGICVGLGSVLFDFPGQPEKFRKNVEKSRQVLRLEELYLLQRNYVVVFLLLMNLIHICTGDVSLFFKRKFISKYFTFWSEAVEIMKIDAATYPKSVRRYMVGVTAFYVAFLAIFLVLNLLRIAPVSTGAPNQLAILWIRPIYAQIHASSFLFLIRYSSGVVCPYIVMCCKVYVLLLMYKCKILTNAFATWNGRLDKVITDTEKNIKRTRKEECDTRTGLDHLFHDYVILLDLLRGADTMFTNIIESYFGAQTISLCFEIYYFLRCLGTPEEFKESRKLDAVIIGVYLFHSLVFLLLALNATADVGDVAMEGLEIIRRHGCMGRKSNKHMYFILSLYMSYTGHFQTALTGGRFVTYDKSFILAMVGTMIGYFIILGQFSPPMATIDAHKLGRINATEVLGNAEATIELRDYAPGRFRGEMPHLKLGYDMFINASSATIDRLVSNAIPMLNSTK